MPYTATSSIPMTKKAAAGAAVYSKFLLSIYDVEVLMFELPVIFKCPLRRLMRFFDENISGNHLDVGVGTGYFLDHCRFPVARPNVHLMDLNPNSLEKTAQRIRRYNPVAHRWNILEPIAAGLPVFSSISTVNLLHCLPGTMVDKEIVFKNLHPFLERGGVFFGATILGQGVSAGPLYRLANLIYNKSSIFSNLNDNAADLETILSRNFTHHAVQVIGSLALFKGVK